MNVQFWTSDQRSDASTEIQIGFDFLAVFVEFLRDIEYREDICDIQEERELSEVCSQIRKGSI